MLLAKVINLPCCSLEKHLLIAPFSWSLFDNGGKAAVVRKNPSSLKCEGKKMSSFTREMYFLMKNQPRLKSNILNEQWTIFSYDVQALWPVPECPLISNVVRSKRTGQKDLLSNISIDMRKDKSSSDLLPFIRRYCFREAIFFLVGSLCPAVSGLVFAVVKSNLLLYFIYNAGDQNVEGNFADIDKHQG